MPPWGAVKGFGDFKSDLGLSQEEIGRIADWVEGGAPEGEPVYLPGSMGRRPEAETRAARTRALQVRSGTVLNQPVSILTIRPKDLADGAAMKVVAETPEGALEPLLWTLPFRSKYRRTYRYAQPVKLPAGTRIRVSPAGGVFELGVKD